MAKEKLRVEQKADDLIGHVAALLRKIPYHCNACVHLEKSADATSMNIGEGVAVFKPRKKAEKLDIARGEAREVQRALHAIVAKGKLKEPDIAPAAEIADHIIGMLTIMIKNLETRM